MKTRGILLILLAALLGGALMAPGATAVARQSETDVTGAGDGIFPPGASLSGVSLSGSQFAIGVIVYADGTALGTYQSILVGTSLLGQSQNISLDGNVAAGRTNTDGSVTFSGACILDMGDGTLPSTGVPFTLTVTAAGAQTLVIAATTLPTQTLGTGSVTIE
jgi:hypothetical protein